MEQPLIIRFARIIRMTGNRDTCNYLRRAVGRCRLYGYKREKRYAEKQEASAEAGADETESQSGIIGEDGKKYKQTLRLKPN